MTATARGIRDACYLEPVFRVLFSRQPTEAEPQGSRSTAQPRISPRQELPFPSSLPVPSVSLAVDSRAPFVCQPDNRQVLARGSPDCLDSRAALRYYCVPPGLTRDPFAGGSSPFSCCLNICCACDVRTSLAKKNLPSAGTISTWILSDSFSATILLISSGLDLRASASPRSRSLSAAATTRMRSASADASRRCRSCSALLSITLACASASAF